MAQPVRSIKNQYRGINAHLHSYFQAETGWKGFHLNLIGDMSRALQTRLLPMGYVVDSVPSLQINRLDIPDSEPESDITIYDTDAVRSGQSVTMQPAAGSAALVMPALQLIDEQISEKSRLSAITIREFTPEKPAAGAPVAWIELLSPANKIGADARIYKEKRFRLLQSGMVFVEIDYLHETATTFHNLLPYINRRGQPRHPNAHAYRIVVIDPRPDLEEASGYIHEFNVDDPLPEVMIPLNRDDRLLFDFGIPYQKTFEEMSYGLFRVDYARLPDHFQRYSEADQKRVAVRMLAVLKAHQAGQNLENAPLSLDGINLETALTELQQLLTV
jgi:hypothetical protein